MSTGNGDAAPHESLPGVIPKPEGAREFSIRAVIAGVVVACIMGASYPYVVLKLGFGPNVSVVAAFFGYLFLGILFRNFTRWENNIVQTAGTSAAQTAFMCISLAAFDLMAQQPGLNFTFKPMWYESFLWLMFASLLGILLAVPLGELSLVTGTWDALVVLGRQWGSAGDAVVLALGIGFLYACVANVVTWSLGVNRVAATAAMEGALPAALARIHPRYGTPYVAFVVTGLVATALLVGNAALGSADNVFWMVFKLSGVCLLVSYLLLFPAFLVLRHRKPHHPRPYVMPGGPVVAWLAAGFCWLFVAASCLLFFRPAPTAADAASAVRESWILLAETLATAVIGLILMPRLRQRPGRA